MFTIKNTSVTDVFFVVNLGQTVLTDWFFGKYLSFYRVIKHTLTKNTSFISFFTEYFVYDGYIVVFKKNRFTSVTEFFPNTSFLFVVRKSLFSIPWLGRANSIWYRSWPFEIGGWPIIYDFGPICYLCIKIIVKKCTRITLSIIIVSN